VTPARILIIDDEAPIRHLLRVALEAEGHTVTEAGTPGTASAPPRARPLRW